MTHTAVTFTPWMKDHLVQGHNRAGKPVANWDFPALPGMGGLRSTMNDMLTFAAANLSPERTDLTLAMRDSHRGLRLTGEVPAYPGMRSAFKQGRVGFNWFTSRPGERRITWTVGLTGGCSSFLGLDMEARRAVVVLTNTGLNSVDYVGFHLLDPAVPLARARGAGSCPLGLIPLLRSRQWPFALRSWRQSCSPRPAARRRPSAPDCDAVPLIPREVLFGNPARTTPQLSPDGTKLAYLAPEEGVLNIWVRTVGKEDDAAVTHDRGRGIRQYSGRRTAKTSSSCRTKGATKTGASTRSRLTGGTPRDLTPLEGVQAQIVAVEPSRPEQILVAIHDRDPRYHDVYEIDLGTGSARCRPETTSTRSPGSPTTSCACARARYSSRMAAPRSCIARPARDPSAG